MRPLVGSWVLQNTVTGEYFTLPYGDPETEWTIDADKAYRFVLEERARQGASESWHHQRKTLQVIEL